EVELSLALGKRQLRLLALGYVVGDTAHVYWLAMRVAFDRALRRDPAQAVGVQAEFETVRGSRADGCPELRHHAGAVLRVDSIGHCRKVVRDRTLRSMQKARDGTC